MVWISTFVWCMFSIQWGVEGKEGVGGIGGGVERRGGGGKGEGGRKIVV